jgi:hypothetical protein
LCKERPLERLALVIKLHPENVFEEFLWIKEDHPDIEVHFVAWELSPREVIAISDLVVGMTSVMLLESMLAGKPTISVQLNVDRDSMFVATLVGAVPLLRTAEEARDLLKSLWSSQEARRAYVTRQATWSQPPNATHRCIDAMRRAIIETPRGNKTI